MNKIKKLERQIKKAKDKVIELEKEIAQAHQEEGVDVPQQVFTKVRRRIDSHKIMSADGWVAPLQPSFSQVIFDESHYDIPPDILPTDGFPKDDKHSLQQY